MIDIDGIEAVARNAANYAEEIGEQDWFQAHQFAQEMAMEGPDAEYCATLSPTVAIKVMAELRQLRADRAALLKTVQKALLPLAHAAESSALYKPGYKELAAFYEGFPLEVTL